MKQRITIIGILSILFLLGGCRQPSAKPAATIKTPPAALTTLLATTTHTIPADRGGSKPTRSRFYQANGDWHWRLTRQDKLLVQGKVTQLKPQGDLTYTMRVTPTKGHPFQLTFNWIDETKHAYHLQANAHQLNATYIIGDNGKAWLNGAPKKVVGTWTSPLYISDTYNVGRHTDKHHPYTKVELTINKSDIKVIRATYTKKGQVGKVQANWAVNSDLHYQPLGHDTYILRAYEGSPADYTSPLVYQVTCAQGKLSVPGIDTSLPYFYDESK